MGQYLRLSFMKNSPIREKKDWRAATTVRRNLCALLRINFVVLCAGLLLGVVPSAVVAQTKTVESLPKTVLSEKVDLIVPKTFPKNWAHYARDGKTSLKTTWSIDATTDKSNPILVCTGKPSGYLRTTKSYKNFELTFEWMYPAANPNCNSGVLVHLNGNDKLWPKSIQVQLHRQQVGSLFPHIGATVKQPILLKVLPANLLALKKWHSCKIRCNNGTITVTINGKQVSEVTGCKPSSGSIAFQSEGSEISFRRIQIQEIIPAPKPIKFPLVAPKPALPKAKPPTGKP